MCSVAMDTIYRENFAVEITNLKSHLLFIVIYYYCIIQYCIIQYTFYIYFKITAYLQLTHLASGITFY